MQPSRPVTAATPTLAETGEFTLIHRITSDLPRSSAVSVGVGDDAAVFLLDGSAVTSTDLLVEHVHFRTDWSSARDIGRKSVAVNVADLEAMGATPVAMVVALGAPGSLPVAWVDEFSAGMREESERAGISLVGGDTTSAAHITVSVTVIGQTAGRSPVLRSGAEPGQVVAVRGRLGWAAAGLAVLGRGFRSPRAAVDSQRCPEVPYGQGRVAQQAGATAMIDVSDGLLSDLGHIARASGVVIDLDPARLVVDEPVAAVGQALGKDPMGFVLTGGEDHALAATFPAERVPEGWTPVGVVLEPGVDQRSGVLVGGEPHEGATGWDHFAH